MTPSPQPLHRRLPLVALLALTLHRGVLVKGVPALQGLLHLPWAHVTKWATASLAIGGMHAVSGASTTIELAPIAPSENPATATVGESFTWVFQATDGNKPKSYQVTGLPDGLEFDGTVVSGIASIQGTPTDFGFFTVRIIGWEEANQSGPQSDTYTLRLTVNPAEGFGTFASWTEAEGLAAENAGPNDDPDGDGGDNLLEYAFGFDPNTAEPLHGDQTGLAPISTPEILSQTDDSITIAFIRRKSTSGTDVTYLLESSEDLHQWSPAGGKEQVTPLDQTWEGVVTIIPKPDANTYFRVTVAMNL